MTRQEIEAKAEKMLCEMIQENSPKLITFFLSYLGRQMNEAHAGTMDINQEMTIEGKRFEVNCNVTLNELV